jgi:hypothetical protein
MLSPMITYITVKSRSVIAAAIFHGTLNAIAGITALYTIGGTDLTKGLSGAAGFAVLLIANVGFYLYDKYASKEEIFTSKIFE